MMKVAPLRPPSDEEAVLNSRTYAVRDVSHVLHSGVSGVEMLPSVLLRAIAIKAWEEFETPSGNVYRNRTMVEWIVAKPPQGLGSSVDTVRQLLTATAKSDAALLAFDREMQRPDGGANNPTGRNQHKIEDEEVTVDNINGDQTNERPTGTSAQAGIRRLRKAADAGDDKASELLASVIDQHSEMSVHRACKEMGWRKDAPPLKAIQAAWRRADQEQREEIAAWVDEQMSPMRNSRFG